MTPDPEAIHLTPIGHVESTLRAGADAPRQPDVHADGIDVAALEAIDGTPVLDVKCVLDPLEPRSPRPR